MNRNYSATFRIIHWSIALLMTVTLITVLLRLTWLNKFNVSEIMSTFLQDKEHQLTNDDLIVLAKKIRQPMWQWHIYAGYALTGIIALRFLLGFTGKMKFTNPLQNELTGEAKFKAWIYILFYICVTASLVTGLIIELGPRSMKSSMEEIHELSIYYVGAYLLLHLGGVLRAEFTNERGIISRVISGNERDSQ